ncbi:T9SS type A sorting domain-containing protein [Candidatus Poribacteria bacterium]|nr:T9SS type A sorting domain-containing protein [Candidatus Poribacteria bacterium]
MLNIQKAITVSEIFIHNLISLSLFLALFCFSGHLHAQTPPALDFPPGIELDPRHPLEPRESGISPSAISENVEFVGATGGAVLDVFVQENYAYLCAYGVLVILDISAPANPTKVGYIALPDRAWGVYVSGSYAYVADCGSGLRVIDVSSPSNPFEVGFYDTPGEACGVYVSGSLAYVADGSSGLRVIDVSSPSNPREVGFYDTPGSALGVYVSGSYAYVADYGSGLRVIDVSSPSKPREVGFYVTPDYAWDVYVSGSYAYVADSYSGLRVIDVSSPSKPKEVGFYVTPGYAYGVYVSSSYAYVADCDYGLRVIDVSSPSNPFEVGFYDTLGKAYDVYVSGSYAYVADYLAGFRVIDISSPENPKEVGFYDTPGYAYDVYVSGSYAYVADYLAGFRVIDISSPENPKEVGFYDTPGSAYGVYVSESYAYVADGYSGLRVIDVSSPSNPFEVGFYDTPGYAYDVYVSGSYAYVADYDKGLHVIDVFSPSNPREVGFYDTPGKAYGVYVSGSYAYVADWNYGLRVIDVSSPSNPREVGFCDTPSLAYGVYVSGSYAYVADGYSGLRVIDVSSPENPREVGFYDTPGIAYGVYVSGSYAYVADSYDSGLRVIDVSSPGNPFEVGFYYTPGYAYDVYVSGGLIYVADEYGGLYILRYTGGVPPEIESLLIDVSHFPTVNLLLTIKPTSISSKLTKDNFAVTENGSPVSFTAQLQPDDKWQLAYTSPNPTSARNYVVVTVKSPDIINATAQSSYAVPVITQFSLGDASGIAGQEVKVPFSISQTDFRNAHAVVNYNPDLLTYVDILKEPDISIEVAPPDVSQPGKVGLDFTASSSFVGGKVLDLVFRISESAVSLILLSFTDANATDASGVPLVVHTDNGSVEAIAVEPVIFESFIPAEEEASEVMQGGIFHRYYKVKSGENILKNAVVYLSRADGAAEDLTNSNEEGVVDIPFNISSRNPGSYELTLPVSKVEVSGQLIPIATPLPRFVVEVKPRDWRKRLEIVAEVNLPSREFESGVGIDVIQNSPDEPYPRTLVIDRRIRAGTKLKGSPEAFKKLSERLKDATDFQANLGFSGVGSVIIGDRFTFDFDNRKSDKVRAQEAVVLLDTLASGGIIANPAVGVIAKAIVDVFSIDLLQDSYDSLNFAFKGEVSGGLDLTTPSAKGMPFKNYGIRLNVEPVYGSMALELGGELSLQDIFDDTNNYMKFDLDVEFGGFNLDLTRGGEYTPGIGRLKLVDFSLGKFDGEIVKRAWGDGRAKFTLVPTRFRGWVDGQTQMRFAETYESSLGRLGKSDLDFIFSTVSDIPAIFLGSDFLKAELENNTSFLADSNYSIQKEQVTPSVYRLELPLVKKGFELKYLDQTQLDTERGEMQKGRRWVLQSGYDIDQYTIDPEVTMLEILGDSIKGIYPWVESRFEIVKKKVQDVASDCVKVVNETGDFLGEVSVNGVNWVKGHTMSLMPYLSYNPFAPNGQAFQDRTVAHAALLGMRSQNLLEPYAATVGESMLFNVLDPNGELIVNFPEPLRLTIMYTETDLANVGLSETEEPMLRIFGWNDDLRRWVQIGGMPDIEANKVTTDISHSGTYAIGIDTESPKMGVLPKDGSTVGPKPVIEVSFEDFVAIDESSFLMTLNDGQKTETLVDASNVADYYDALANVVTYTFEAPLSAGTYLLTVSVQDSAGNSAQAQSSFTVDVDAFEVVQTTPADGATEVDPLKEISATFSKSVDAESVNLSAFQLRCVEDGRLLSGKLTTTDATITFLPDMTLLPAMEYALTIRGGDDGIKDTAGKTLSNDIEVKFTTSVSQSKATHLIIDAPEQAPVNGMLQVTASARDADERLVSTYSGAVHFSSTDVVAVLPNDYTFHYGDLGEHIFTVTFLTKGAQTITVEDADNGLAQTSSEIRVSSAPSVENAVATPNNVLNDGIATFVLTATITDPDGLGTVVGVTANLSEIGGSETENLFDDGKNGDGDAGDGVYGKAGLTVPDTILASIYTLEITATDEDGEHGGAYLTLTVQEANPPDITIPTVVKVTPADNAKGIPIDVGKVEVVFSEEMDIATLTADKLTVEDEDSNVLAGAFSVVDATTIRYTLEANLTYSTNYFVTVKGGLFGVKDLSGNGLGGDFQSKFRSRDYGDVSGNGTISAFDAVLVLQYLVQLITLSDEAQNVADVSNDGTISALDAALILQWTVGLIQEFPIESGAAPSGFDQEAIGTLSIGNLRAKPGSRVSVPVLLNGEEIYGGVFDCEISGVNLERKIKPIALKQASQLAGFSTVQNISGDKFQFAFANTRSLSIQKDGQAIVNLEFEIPADIPGGSDFTLHIAHAKLNEATPKLVDGRLEILPLKTALLANYPNPFNPDTWIPYELADASDVTIEIYDVAGRLVRTLRLGKKDTGSYTRKENAACWDGRNAHGERAASGVYFYTMRAGDFITTRKMVIVK